jgi:hypothetical protein
MLPWLTHSRFILDPFQCITKITSSVVKDTKYHSVDRTQMLRDWPLCFEFGKPKLQTSGS